MYRAVAERLQRLSLSPLTTTRYLCSIPNPQNDDVEKIFRIITASPDPKSLKHSLKNSQIPLSSDLIDRVLKRVRFSHSNPLSALELYKLASRINGFLHTAYSLDTMLYVLGRTRKFEEMWEVLVETKRKDKSLITPRTVQVVLARIAKVCSVRQTVESFKKFRKLVLKFDVSCYNALFRTLSQEKSMSDARNVYHSLKHEFRPNLYTFNILLSGWRSCDEAEAFFAEMRGMGVKPDLVSYNCLVDVFCKGREMGKAYELIGRMRDEGIDLDVITYTSLIGGLGLVGQPDKARDVLKEMREYGCYPDVAAYNAVIRNFCIAKRLGDAYGLMEEMAREGLSPNATTFNVVLRSLYWANDLRGSWGLYLRMKGVGCLPSTQSCMFLIRVMRRQENVGLALELWGDMVEKGFGSYILVSDVLFDLLCDAGKLEEAERCFLQMLEKGQKPSQVSFRRIKVLMELAGRDDALANLSEKMSVFGPVIQKRRSYVDELDRPVSGTMI
ncbi:putative pentatricopeptide repeat-containing protein [Salvia divinorum]|uniref:Pentatricopeptide repeat-containing protein n=1 Tax=Salvia divinorum TaxID=28513 RepID=A0ABD1HM46_SALDI